MVRSTSTATGEIELLNLSGEHLTEQEERYLVRQVQTFAQVTSARIERNLLIVTIDMGKLTGEAYDAAARILFHRIDLQVERCKTRHLRAVRVRV